MKFTKQAVLLLALCCTATCANPLLGGILGGVGKIGGDILGGVGKISDGILGGIRGGVNGAHNVAGDALNGVGHGIDAANNAADSVLDGVKGGLDAGNKAANHALDGVGQLVGDIQKGISGGADAGSKLVGGLLDDVSDGVGGVVDAATGLAGELANGLATAVAKILGNSVGLATDLVGAVGNVATKSLLELTSKLGGLLESLGNIAGKVKSGVKRLALKKTLIELEAIKAASNALIEGLLRLGSELDAIHEKHIADLQDNYNNWADEQLERVHVATDGGADDEAGELVDEFNNRYANYINNCVGEIDQQKADFEDQVDETVEDYKQGLDGVINQVEECLKSDDSFRSSKRCATELAKSLLPLAKAPKDLFDLKLSGEKLLINGLIHSACMVKTLAQLELEKSNLAGQLDDLIDEHNTADNSTPSEEA